MADPTNTEPSPEPSPNPSPQKEEADTPTTDAQNATSANLAEAAALALSTNNHPLVYVRSQEHAWIPARVLETDEELRTSALSIPVYATELKICSDAGRSAQSFRKKTIELKDYPNGALPLQNVDSDGRLLAVEDMVDLPFLHEAAILYNLKDRHIRGKPYTRTGDIVIACNPYQWFHELYNEETQRLYAAALVWKTDYEMPPKSDKKEEKQHRRKGSSKRRLEKESSQSSNAASTPTTSNNKDIVLDPRRSLEPHIYEAASLAYRGLAVDGQDQSILVSGESGAGKTESVKICLHHIAAVQNPNQEVLAAKPKEKFSVMAKEVPGSPLAAQQQSNSSSPIVQRVLDSNPLLEAFGNAQTVRNDNSSRFGKYVQLQFDAEDPIAAAMTGKVLPSCVLAGSYSEVYLLEKSRVVHHEPDERTYHIFYQLLAAEEDVKTQFWDGLADTDQESFAYVGYADIDTIEGLTDAERFGHTLEALELVGISGDKLKTLMRAICIVLQLGNLVFEPQNASEERGASTVTSVEELEALAELMMGTPVSPEDGSRNAKLVTASLTIRTIFARGEEFKVPLTADQAKDSCDAFAKEIYAKAFLWLVRAINDATSAERNYQVAVGRAVARYGTIGLLDIFGFESFEVNRFEQLCINYANEKLQQKFTLDIFRSVQSEYEAEGIALEEITYDDNADVLDLVEGRMGLLAFLNEECVRPGGSDKGFVAKVEAMNSGSADNGCFYREMFFGDCEFGIRHYAGAVVYDANGFVTKNTDTLATDLQECATKSTNEILAQHLQNESMTNPRETEAKNTMTSPDGIGKKKRPQAARKRPPAAKRGGQGGASGGGVAARHAAKLSGGGSGEAKLSASFKSQNSSIVGSTVWTKFKGQLTTLMSNLCKTRTRYIRCIKPNTHKEPLVMEHSSTVEQLRCAGVVAAVTISRSAFPNRLDHEVVLERFRALWERGAYQDAEDDFVDMINDISANDVPDNASFSSLVTTDETAMGSEGSSGRDKFMVDKLLTPALKILEKAKPAPKDELFAESFDGSMTVIKAFVLGKSRTYFRAGALEQLEAERLKRLGNVATEIQKVVREFVARWKYHRLRNAVICLQARARKRAALAIYLQWRASAIRMQCWMRCIWAARMLIKLRRNYSATLIQTRWRMGVAITMLKENRKAAAAVQTMVRGALQRPKFRLALQQKREEEKLTNQVLALQRKLEEAENRRLEAEKAAEERTRKAIEEFQKEEEEKKKEAAAQQEPSLASEAGKEGNATVETSADGAAAAESEQLSIQHQQQQTLMDESGKMLEYLRKEVFRLRSQNAQMRTDFDLLKDNNQRLMDANASAGASFSALNQHAKHLTKTNDKINAELMNAKQNVQKLSVVQVELKEELKMKNATYVAEVHSRLQHQKALSNIVDLIQARCRDSRLVEDVLQAADDCEAEYMNGPTSTEGPAPETPNRRNGDSGGLMSSFRNLWS